MQFMYLDAAAAPSLFLGFRNMAYFMLNYSTSVRCLRLCVLLWCRQQVHFVFIQMLVPNLAEDSLKLNGRAVK